ncbi:hypothetical protein Tco_0652391 [Tanacetum coccineum]|uniref:Reverse transcriptase domain-containing protein n=1 Tax=Tanacetum coccineum TaxID=301880 RepID=A0ABQ4WXJ7_9ASTR
MNRLVILKVKGMTKELRLEEAWVGNQGNFYENDRNQNGNVVDDNIRGNVRNVMMNNNQGGCSYKEFLTCNPKEYDGKGGAIVFTRWIEKMEFVQDMSGCRDNQKVKYTTGSFVVLMREEFCLSNETQKLETELCIHAIVEACHAAYIDRFHELARLVPHLIAGALTDEALRNGSIKKNPENRGNVREPSKDRNVRDDNKRTRTGNAFATTANPNVNPMNVWNLTHAHGACFGCRGTDHYKTACPRLIRAQGLGGDHPNQVVANNRVQGRENYGNQARGRALMLGAKEARQDSNIVTSMFTLNDHYATTLFDSGVGYSFVSTTFIPLLGIEPNDLGFSYEIEIASGAMPVAESPNRLASYEMEELSGQLKEL